MTDLGKQENNLAIANGGSIRTHATHGGACCTLPHKDVDAHILTYCNQDHPPIRRILLRLQQKFKSAYYRYQVTKNAEFRENLEYEWHCQFITM